MRTPLSLLALALLSSGCISYGVGTTAATVAPGERHVMTLVEATPAWDRDPECEVTPYDDCTISPSTVRPMVSNEVRVGIDEQSDWGVRLIGYSGLVASYKRRFTPRPEGMQMAVIGGMGVFNGLNTLGGELTLVVSAPEGPITPYGGLRAQQTVPLTNDVGQDDPTIGVFMGARLGSTTFGISPEIGVHYDPSVLGAYDRKIVVVPVITLHGRGVLNGLF